MKRENRVINEKMMIHIERNMTGGSSIYIIYHDRSSGKMQVAKPVTIEFGDWINEFKLPEPTMRMDGIFGKQFINAMGKALEKDGFQSTKEDQMEGRMNAMKNHLDDMRQLVFKDKVISQEKKNG